MFKKSSKTVELFPVCFVTLPMRKPNNVADEQYQ